MAQQKVARKKAYHHGDLKTALLDETVRILREEGEDHLSLRRLGSNLGVSRTAPYNHFDSKDSLLDAVAEEGFLRFQKAMDGVRRRHRGQSGDRVTKALVKAYVHFARNNVVYYNLMYGSKSWHATSSSGSLKTTARGILRAEIERLKRGQSRGQIAPDVDVVRYAHMYWGTLHGISRLLLDGVYTGSESVSKLCDSTADMLWSQVDPGTTTR